MVMGDNSGSQCCGFKSLRHILNGHGIFHIEFNEKKLYCLFEKTKINEKEAEKDKRDVSRTFHNDSYISNILNFYLLLLLLMRLV